MHVIGVLRHSRIRVGVGLCVGALALVAGGTVGCRQSAPETPTPTPEASLEPIRVLVVDDPPLAEAIASYWRSRSESEIELRELDRARLTTARQLVADVVVYPSACLGTLVERDLIRPLADETLQAPELATRDVFELERSPEVRWGDHTYAVSFGSPQFVLLYRPDLLAAQGLAPPRTWQEYKDVAVHLQRDQLGALAPAADRPWSAVIEPLSEGWAGRLLLARAAAYALHPSQYSSLFEYTTMEPLIAGPPFVRALEQLVAAREIGPATDQRETPESARQAFWRGEAGMVLTWPSAAAVEEIASPASEPPPTAWAELPGADQVYNFAEQTWSSRGDPARGVALLGMAGRLGSVTQTARHPREAGQFLAWLTGPDGSLLVAPRSAATTLYRNTHLKQPAVWVDRGQAADVAHAYAELVARTQSRPTHLDCLRIPGGERYLAALEQGVLAALAGGQSPADALAEVARQWTAIRDELGIESQRTAYTHSLGLEP